MTLVDAHCHIEGDALAQVDALVARAQAAGVSKAVIVGQFQAPGDFGQALSAAAAHPDFFVLTYGIHPHDAAKATEADWAELDRLVALPQVHAVGETGFDFFYNHSPREPQEAAFRRQCTMAKVLHKPLVVHVRDAHDDAYRLLKEEGVTDGVIHCFTGGPEDAKRYVDLGLHISISGIVTYKKTEALAEAVTATPLERLLVETDSPYLAPIPHRGKKNEMAFVVETTKKVAQLKARPWEEVATVCAENTARLFRFAL